MKTLKASTAIICLSSNNGGMELDSIKLAKKLSPYSQIILITKKDSFIASQQNDYKGINNIILETISFKSNLGPSLIFNTRNILKKYAIKNVIFFGASELKSLYFAFLGLDINLIIRHGTTKSRPKKDFFHKLIYSNVNYHVSISKHLLKNVRHIIPFGRDSQEKLIYSSFDIRPIKHSQEAKLSLLHIGRIVRGKGQIDAIKACQILIDNGIDFEFKIVGSLDPNFKEIFLQFYNNCSYKDKIEIIDHTKNVYPYLAQANIFIFPSHGEGLGNAFLEALSSQLCCLSYKNTTFIEFKEELDLYFSIAEDKDINDLKNKLLKITQNLHTEQIQSSKNCHIIQQVFSKKQEINKYLKILK